MDTTLEQRVERLWDIQQIKNLMGRYEYYHTAQEHMKTVELFALKSEGIRIDVVGMGIYEGVAGVKKFFYDWHNSLDGDRKGSLNIHLLTTEVIEVADDGRTARAVWMSPGLETRHSRKKGGLQAFWNWGKYAVDFLKEDGQWKFWHFTITNDFFTDYNTSWVDKGLADDTDVIFHSGKPAPDKPSSFEPDFYGVDKIKRLFPVPPEPYETFEE